MAEQRERWSGRTAFIMAAVGSAVGLGNVWRFPGVAFENGGGAFFIPYFVALLTAGIPLMIVEYGIGSRFQGSAPKSFRQLGKRFEWVGWWAVLVGLIISFYYCIILAWSWDYCWGCLQGIFKGSLPWTEGAAGDYFASEISQHKGASPTSFGGFNAGVVVGLALTWIAVWFCIIKGVHAVGKVVMITVPLPLLILVLLAVRGLTLPHAMDGLAYYLTPRWNMLANADTWLAAYGQVFFSLSVGWGILIAYASFRAKDSDVVNCAYMTSFANCGFSFIAGFAVFSTLGYLGFALNTPIPELDLTSFGLAFTAYPTAIEHFDMAMGMKALLALGFFFMLLTLGIDSAFSIVEAVATAVKDKFGWSRAKVVTTLCVIGFLAGLVYCGKSALFWLDTTDAFMSDFGLSLVALVQCLVVGWFLPKGAFKDLQDDINARSELRTGALWRLCIKFITPLVLILLITKKCLSHAEGPYGGYPTSVILLAGVLPAALIIVLSFVLQQRKGRGEADKWAPKGGKVDV